ncbi:CRISPR-associated protein, Cse4 family [Paucidesulfovibrio gracilis DSM 16080]|uniref:CRISPR-associated protein, Cse4 family n=1 Tax=Paucidesulfovibrio gracilis DSM 16080 TaxID=1121449 RepID=A0A1T4XWA0_9BACT|nr:type I-E CRISPR-associated protein Cas7/Cse4/CasC [Paucidesulfovibrio gracilis]SKA93784.1 CRISPR-associated protein, Cse4 family [Paucidesulfovibrio gracilis DSM 16080]
MSRFIQLHVLTTYPASNLNRDDLGRPKTVKMGGCQRLRVSSQSLKRAWRTSEHISGALCDHFGKRTKEVGKYAYFALTNGVTFAESMEDIEATGDLPTLKQAAAAKIARAVAGVFAKNKAEYKAKADKFVKKDFLESLETEQMAHLNPVELAAVGELVETCRETGKEPEKDALDLLRGEANAVDVAMFGRMLASRPEYNVEAAVQVAHAMTVHKAVVEDDFFTAVDDLNRDDPGAGHMGVAEFGAGLFYLYVCVDRDLLLENLGGDENLCNRTLGALARAVYTVSPSGKQNSFASRAVASYCVAEKGDAHARTLAEAFLKPVNGEDMLADALAALETKRESFNAILGEEAESIVCGHGRQTLKDLCDFIAE